MKKLALIIFTTEENPEYEKLLEGNSKLMEQVEVHPVLTENLSDTYDSYMAELQQIQAEYVAVWTEKDIITQDVINKMVAELKDAPIYKIRVRKVEATWKTWPVILFCYSAYIMKTADLKALNIPKASSRIYRENILLEMTKKYSAPIELEKVVLETYEILENDRNIYEYCLDPTWYLDDLQNFYIPYLKNNRDLNKTVQQRIYAGIVTRYFMNMNEKDKMAILDEQIDQFFELTKEIIAYIDDDVIAARDLHRNIPVTLTHRMFREKHGDNLQYKVRKKVSPLLRKKAYEYYINGLSLGEDLIRLRLQALNYENEKLQFDCEVSGNYLMNDPEKDFFIVVDGKQIPHEKLDFYNMVKFFGRTINRFYQTSFSIPLQKIHPNMKIQFFAISKDGKKLEIPLAFPKVASRLTKAWGSHYEFDRYMLVAKGNKLLIKEYTKVGHVCREAALLAFSVKYPNEFKRKLYYPMLRVLYWIQKGKYSQKDVWIFFDKLYKAGDNAEYLFEYCMKNAPDKDCYYIITKESPDYKRLTKKYKNHILVFGSKKQRLVTMNAKIIFATHAQVWSFCAFKGQMEHCMRDLLTAKVVCIQHGLTVQSIAQYQNRIVDNTCQYFCASKYEIQNLEQSIYGYNKDQLILSGSPRYDGLKSNDQKYLLLTPTWRRNIVINGNAFGTAKTRNPEFKGTVYYKVYNNLIHNEKLLKTAKECGYRIVYLLHPTLSSQAEDFEGNELVEVIPATSGVSYEKMMTEASLMITDYSGVQFDFAYMKKPILYYQPEELPPQYEESVYKYETMAFGPLITKADEIVDALCESMKKGCPMEEMYQRRVDDFFAYTDFNNCKRILDIVMER